jgi:hypothetical protein
MPSCCLLCGCAVPCCAVLCHAVSCCVVLCLQRLDNSLEDFSYRKCLQNLFPGGFLRVLQFDLATNVEASLLRACLTGPHALTAGQATLLEALQCWLGLYLAAFQNCSPTSRRVALCPYCCCCCRNRRVCADESRPQQGARQGRARWRRQGWGWALRWWWQGQGQGRGWGWQGARRQGQGRQGTRQGLKLFSLRHILLML